MRVLMALCIALFCGSIVSLVSAQDAVKVDPKHYSVVSENDQVRILKVHYGPHEKSVMHSHPAAVAVFLTDSTAQFTYPDGKKEAMGGKAGEARFTPAGTHLPENTGDKAMEVIVVELKK
jgi:quercetin dioxygenase-like cupin family protein